MATMARTYPDVEHLVHAALDVAVPFDRYQYLRGFIDGYKAKDQETAGFELYNEKEEKDE